MPFKLPTEFYSLWRFFSLSLCERFGFFFSPAIYSRWNWNGRWAPKSTKKEIQNLQNEFVSQMNFICVFAHKQFKFGRLWPNRKLRVSFFVYSGLSTGTSTQLTQMDRRHVHRPFCGHRETHFQLVVGCSCIFCFVSCIFFLIEWGKNRKFPKFAIQRQNTISSAFIIAHYRYRYCDGNGCSLHYAYLTMIAAAQWRQRPNLLLWFRFSFFDFNISRGGIVECGWFDKTKRNVCDSRARCSRTACDRVERLNW